MMSESCCGVRIIRVCGFIFLFKRRDACFHDQAPHPHYWEPEQAINVEHSTYLFERKMVSAYLVDALRDPTVELQDLFTSASSSATEFPQLVANHFSRVFRTETAYKQVRGFTILGYGCLYIDMVDTSSESPESTRGLCPAISCPVSWNGPRYLSVDRNVSFQVSRWQGRRMGN